MAEARQAVAEFHVYHLEEGREPTQDFIRGLRKNWVRRFYTTRNLIANGLWPTHIYNLGVTTGAFSLLLAKEPKFAKPLTDELHILEKYIPVENPKPLKIVTVSFAGGVVFFIGLMYLRRWTLRLLLRYTGWMDENSRKGISWSTAVWGVFVKLFSGYHPSTNSYQSSLPTLPVPILSDTIDKWLLSVKPLKTETEFEKLSAEAKEFERGVGLKLQRVLILKSWWSFNYVSDWWEKYVYLMSRVPLAINSNYYCLDNANWRGTTIQAARAAYLIHTYLEFHQKYKREEVEPLRIRDTVPLCMAQYERIFGTTRIPGEELDKLVTTPYSKHIIVTRRGLFYKLSIIDSNSKPLNPVSLEKQLHWIIRDADLAYKDYDYNSRCISVLTAIERSDWARNRNKYFSSGQNKESLDAIETALFIVCLETQTKSSWSERGKYLLHGDGETSHWFDKSFQIIVFADAHFGTNCEHAWGDAPVMGHASEYVMTYEILNKVYDDDGHTLDIGYKQANLYKPQKLQWDLSNPDLNVQIEYSRNFAKQNNEDLDLQVIEHTAFGKDVMKMCKVSPDGFVQCAFQYTFFKDSGGKLALTYEASMTRLFLYGRTETVRPLTSLMAEWIREMVKVPRDVEKCRQLMRETCQNHQRACREAMKGKGFDRHLFALLVVGKGFNEDCDFLRKALLMPWTLSTSQQPQQQIKNSPPCDLKAYRNKLCPGGGFGPVADDGYGVSYMFAGEHRLFFHVSSKKSAGNTDSQRFSKTLFETLQEMRELFEV